MRAAIEQRIAEFLAVKDPRYAWLKPVVRTHRFLPLYLGWVAVLGIRPDASLVRWDSEEGPDALRTLTDPFWCRMALCQGAKKYAELIALIPQRPLRARDCEQCRGAGRIPGLPPEVVCKCGGVGWIIPGEEGEERPG